MRFIITLVFTFLFLTFISCKHKEEVKPVEVVEPVKEEPAPVLEKEEEVYEPEPIKPVTEEPVTDILSYTVDELNKMGYLKHVYFDFDKYDIKEEYKKVLEENAAFLKNNKNIKILIEGHCDERGTREYNLALGQKRAEAAKNYLVALGIEEERIDTISYGKERPVALCHNESCWWQNRRAHFVIISK